MTSRETASSDFDKARRKAFWRKVLTWIKGESNELLPFDKFREKLPIHGQHYIGLRQVPVDKIVGSQGRFKDFDREFLPVQSVTRDRWINIDIAHYDDIILPPVDLYKMGDIYFVKDGNHRISVARERQQIYVDAYVTEIDIPVPLSVDIKVEDLEIKQEHAEFLETTQLGRMHPEAIFETHISGQYKRLLEHIDVHRWYLGELRDDEVSYEEAVESWFENIYIPLIDALRWQGIFDDFPEIAEMDMYLWMMDYQYYLRGLAEFREDVIETDIPSTKIDETIKSEAGKLIVQGYPLPSVRKLVNSLNRATWVEGLILEQEKAAFFRQTHLHELRPGVNFETNLPGSYNKLLEHIAVHRWYLGENLKEEVSYLDGVVSWLDTVYMPLISIIREQFDMKAFPERTELDLYLWVITRQWYLKQILEHETTDIRTKEESD